MEGASAQTKWPNPGLLTFKKLAINKGQITRLEERNMQSTIDNQEEIISDDQIPYSKQLRNAARNVKGLMLYHSNKKDEAIEMWEETLAKDPTNLNAMKDIAVAYQKIRFNQKAQEYEKKLENMIKSENCTEKKKLFARCQFEQGYALSQDLHTKSWRGVDLFEEQVRYYEAALNLAEGFIRQDEKRDWLLFTGKAYEKLCHAAYRDVKLEQYMIYIGKAIEKLHKALQMTEENKFYKAEIWLTIATTFTRKLKDKIDGTLPKIVEESYKEDWDNPMRCYNRALECNPNNVWLLGRIGVFHLKQDHYNNAMTELDKAIEMADKLPPKDHQKKSSWNALCHRAKIHINNAKKQKEHAKTSSLLSAQEDALKALEKNYVPFTLTLAGEVHHLLAKNSQTPTDVEAFRKIALFRFYEASILQDGSKITDVHLKWALCLQDAGDLQSAIETFKIAIDTTTSLPSQSTYRAYLGYKLICALLENYVDLDKKHHMLQEICFWFVYIHLPSEAILVEFKGPAEQYVPEIIDMLEYVVQHIGGLTSQAQDLRKRVIQKTLDEMIRTKETKNRDLLRRLELLRIKNTENMEQAPHVTKNIEQAPGASQVSGSQPNMASTYNSPPTTALMEGVDYDFHIIHDETNLDIDGWVRYSLLTGLECKFYSLKGYYQPRDAILGTLVNASRAQKMEKSAKILIVLSHVFDGRNNLTTEMAQCLHQKNTENVILLQREHVEVPPNLRCYKKFDFTVQVNLPELARYLLPVHSMWDI